MSPSPRPRHQAPRRTAEGRERAFRDGREFRPELHGVRGLALTLVVLFHVLGDGRVSGGIDVFLAVTGFLAFPAVLRRSDHRGAIRLGPRFAGLVRRLLVPAVPVLVFVTVAGSVLLPVAARPQLLAEVRASALSYENWELVWSQLAYGAAGPGTSPLQHFWSLSVQGQFHVVAPLIVMAVTVPLARRGRDPRRLLIWVLTAVSMLSFAWSVWATGQNQQAAYFSTFTRAWELTAPGAVALALPRWRLSARSRLVLGWTGLALIVSCGFVLDGGRVFPGALALWPVLGVLLVLIAGESRHRWGADVLLSSRPLAAVADISYSLYLWHWPILILTLASRGHTSATATDALAVILLSVAVAMVSTALVERRLVSWKPLFGRTPRTLVAGVAVLALVVVATTTSIQRLDGDVEVELAAAADEVGGGAHPGAAALVEGAEPLPGEMIPAPAAVPRDLPDHYTRVPGVTPCIQDAHGTEVRTCEYEPAEPRATVVVTGGSHAGQYWAALRALAEENQWHLVLMEKSGCLLAEPRGDEPDRPATSCGRWNEGAMEQIVAMSPDLVVTLGTRVRPGVEEHVVDGSSRAWSRLLDAGIGVVALRDNPRFEQPVPVCLEASDEPAVECGGARSDFYSGTIDEVGLGDAADDRVVFVDTARWLCDATYCPAVVGNVAVYRDKDHLTDTYVRSMTPYLRQALVESFPSLVGSDIGR